MNFWGGVLFLLPTVFSLSITGGRSNVARVLGSAMGLDSVATSPWVRDKWLEIPLLVRYTKLTQPSFLNLDILLVISAEEGMFYPFIFFILCSPHLKCNSILDFQIKVNKKKN